ncbi:Cobalt-precorrin-6x reductase [Rhodovulum sp. PH10]|uniref:cobalt-precorrin-6A reductase n=1 Tax=Rhodovulum sp. PH10 TaxID=1187851 RepID=UPI00027C25E1|nr:Cobalt-precorrin-6x reductase [Rhodovulum sp. PH10]
MRRLRVLILGGTGEARRLAQRLAAERLSARRVAGESTIDAVLSYAGRTESPLPPPIPFRVGGFGGIGGLIDYLRSERIDRVIDATHPFAAQMSTHAVAACETTKIPLLALERKPWTAEPGDRWIEVASLEDAAEAVGATPRRIFLGIGRLHLAAFAEKPQHSYLVRLVDPLRETLPFPTVEVIVARGPFDVASDTAMLERHGSEIVVSKNAGGTASVAKILAARALNLPVVMVRRPRIPQRPSVETVDEVMRWLHGDGSAGVLRGV